MDEKSPNFISTFSPYNDNSVGSFHFDGTNDVITVPDQADLRLGTGEFTVEFWFYMNDIQDAGSSVIVRNVMLEKGGYQRDNSFGIFYGAHDFDGTTADRLFVWNQSKNGTAGTPGVEAMLSYSGTILEDKWYHVAFTRDGTNASKLWVNGDLADTQTSDTTDYGNTSGDGQDLHMGTAHQASYRNLNGTSGTDRDFEGFLSDIRIVKGHDVYTSAFTPPTTALTNISGTGYSTVFLAQPGNKANLNTTTSAPEDRKVFAAISAGIGQEPQTVINEGTSITSSGADTATYNYQCAQCVPALPEGKWYFEVRDRFYYLNIGLMPADVRFNEGPLSGNGIGSRNNTLVFSYSGDLQLIKEDGTADTSYVTTGVGASPGNPGTGDIFSIDYDTVTNTFGVSKNGGTRYTHVIPTSDYVMLGKRIGMADGSSGGQGNLQLNFGQNPTFNGNITPSGGTNSDGSYPDADGIGGFRYAPPTGYKALRFVGPSRPAGLNKAALNPDKYFDMLEWQGIEQAKRVRGLKFKPDLVWLKAKNYAQDHLLFDSVRGFGRNLNSNATTAEENNSNALSAFEDDGFSLGTSGEVQYPGKDYIAWCWKAGEDSFINTDGTIDSECNVNLDAGFSIVSYVGNGTAGATVGHGLVEKPEFIMIKTRQATNDWAVFHSEGGPANRLDLNTTDALLDQATFMNDTAPSSTVFSLGSASSVNADNSTFIAYVWHSVEGYSKIGTYEGNGNADGPFIHTGFKPAWLIIKNADVGSAGYSWYMWDGKRPGFNINYELFANQNSAQDDNPFDRADFLSNGFKIRNTGAAINGNGSTMIYMAFAETPSAFTTGE